MIMTAAFLFYGLVLVGIVVSEVVPWRKPKRPKIMDQWSTVPADFFACRCGDITELHHGHTDAEAAEFYECRVAHTEICGPVMTP